jgi:hypothetical protein
VNNLVNDASGNVAVGNNLTVAGTSTISGNETVTGTLVMGSSFKRNRLINGNMLIDQRNAGAAITINSDTSKFSVDRWYFQGQNSDGVFTVQQSSVAPAGFTKSILLTVTTSDTSLGATQTYFYKQSIEGYNVADLGWGASGAQTVTLSFWVRSSLTGTFSGAINNGAFNRGYPFTFTINAANTWEQKTVTITGDTTGTWPTDNSSSLQVYFAVGSGSTYLGTANAWAAAGYVGATGQTNLISTNGATFYVTGVQLEVGTKATPYEMQIYSDQLAQCCRYYQPLGGSITLAVPYVVTSTLARQAITFPVTMRASPTVVLGTPSYTNTSSLSVVSNDAYTVSLGWLTTSGGGQVSSVALNATAEL